MEKCEFDAAVPLVQEPKQLEFAFMETMPETYKPYEIEELIERLMKDLFHD